MSGFSVKPEFSVPLEYGLEWRDPITGLIIPKNPDKNRKWREKMLRDSENDEGFQRDILAACKESRIFWVNAFAWTYHQKDVDPETHREKPADVVDWPFITWPIQDDLFVELDKCFKNGEDILIDKSRQMGASWICLTFLHHIWLFRPHTEIRLMSRQEGLVDGNSDSLFWKLDYLNKWMPDWMRPPGVMTPGKDNRTRLRMYNCLNESTHAGEATTSVALSGGQAALLFLDEFSKVQNGDKIRSATRDVASCRIVNSTPFGAGTEYSTWRNSGQIKVFPLMFWNHPEKGRGRYITQDDTGAYHIRSPWFDYESKVRKKTEMAQEILAEDIESGQTVFNITNIDKHISLFVKEPKIRLNVILKSKIANDQLGEHIRRKNIDVVDFRQVKEGKLLVWTNLVFGQPDQSLHYIFGIDTSKGQGASESVVSIKCKETKEKIARWSDANTPPYDFARIVVALALWCGGANPQQLPFLKWEKNGPGWDLGRLLVKVFGYPFYYINERPGVLGSGLPKTGIMTYGWQATPQSKSELLQLYDRVLAQGGYINHDKKALEQAKLYIHYPSGGCGPASLQYEDQSARKLHGDIVIADALTLEDDKIRMQKPQSPEIPQRSFEYRKRQWDKKIKESKKFVWRKRYDFTKEI